MAKKSSSTVSSDYDLKWRVESDLRTLVEAIEIRKDKKRFKAAQVLARTKATELKSVAEVATPPTKKE